MLAKTWQSPVTVLQGKVLPAQSVLSHWPEVHLGTWKWGRLLEDLYWTFYSHKIYQQWPRERSGSRTVPIGVLTDCWCRWASLFCKDYFCMKSAEAELAAALVSLSSARPATGCDRPDEGGYCALSHLPSGEGYSTNLSIGAHRSNAGGSHCWHTLPKINKSMLCLPYLVASRNCKDSARGNVS